jgi:hypothetical protein
VGQVKAGRLRSGSLNLLKLQEIVSQREAVSAVACTPCTPLVSRVLRGEMVSMASQELQSALSCSAEPRSPLPCAANRFADI